jgi:hypothetical protein
MRVDDLRQVSGGKCGVAVVRVGECMCECVDEQEWHG